MSATLSRRHGRVATYPPLLSLLPEEKLALGRLTAKRGTEFDDLPARYQQLIVEAEANRQRHIEAIAAGHPEALDSLWEQAAGALAREPAPAGAAGSRRRQRTRTARALSHAPSTANREP